MSNPGTSGQIVLGFGLVLMVMLVTACAGFEPYEPRNHRVEGPKQGLISGESGEFVIYEKAEKTVIDDEERKNKEQNSPDAE
jgi:hypothetical protein